jgi:hypothetical protein
MRRGQLGNGDLDEAEEVFTTEIAELNFGRMMYHVVYLPAIVQRRFTAGERARVVGTVGGMPFKGGVLHAGGGRQYLLLSKKFLKSAGLAVGSIITIRVRLDDPNAVELVPEFERALEAHPIASQAWKRLTPGTQRGFAHRVASAKQATTRRARIEECIDSLCETADDQ